MSAFDAYLTPIREDAPAGEDPSVTGVLFELETAAQGTPETQFAPAVDADWKAVRGRCLEVLAVSRDLRVASILCAALLRTDGLPGFRDGIALMRGLVEQLWPSVHPQYDAAGGEDAYERVNPFQNLAAPVGTDGDILKVRRTLRRVPLVKAPRAGAITLAHHLLAKGTEAWPADLGAPPSPALADAAKQEAAVEEWSAVGVSAAGAAADLEAVVAFFKEKAGASTFPSMAPLVKDLKLIAEWLAPPGAVAAVAAGAEAEDGGGAAAGFGGTVRSRQEVELALEAVIAYYKAHEPSSPIPYLLLRTKRLVGMNFMELITELTPESRDKILGLTGPTEDGAPKS